MTIYKPIRVVWLCNFSNAEVRGRLSFSSGRLDSLLRRITKSNVNIHLVDYGQWITNGINEVKNNDDIELHVISPHYRLKTTIQEFKIDGVFYHFYADESFSFFWKILAKIGLHKKPQFEKNGKIISGFVQHISPHIFHLIGVENINYSSFTLKYSLGCPFIVQLQTLVNDPKVYASLSDKRDYIKDIESAVLNKADYIFTVIPKYISIIRNAIAPNSIILANKLAVGVELDKREIAKEYDFVYFSANISKAADLAIEAFAIAKQFFPSIKLSLIGFCSTDFKLVLNDIIQRNDLSDSVSFQGLLSSHDDVMRNVKKSKFALLPLRPDMLPSTIREAMALGCPVITTITPSTTSLNKDRLSVLLSEPDSPQSLAENMCRLLNEPNLASLIKENAYITIQEMYDNKATMQKVRDSYIACLNNYYYNIPIPHELML